MSVQLSNYMDNPNVTVLQNKGSMAVIEYNSDLSVNPSDAITEYFCSKMNIRQRQLLCEVDDNHGIILQAGAMQAMLGNISATTGVHGVGDFIGKAFSSKVSGESVIKPEYVGNGTLITEPTYKHLVLFDVEEFGGSVILDDGLFLACENSLKQKIAARTNVSSAVLGNEGLFNLSLNGTGMFCIESPCPKDEMITIDLKDDVVKLDGNFAMMWTTGLQFTVERSGKSLIGSAASGEGFVNVYRGTGRIIVRPLR